MGTFSIKPKPWLRFDTALFKVGCYVPSPFGCIQQCFPTEPTRGQDDTPDLRGGREGCMCACVEGGLLPSFRSTRFISWCSSWLMLTLSLRKFWPQMFPKIKSIFFSSFSDNNSIVLLIYNPLTAWLLPLFWHLMLKFGAVIIQHFILALLSKKNSSWFVASMQGKKK